MELKNGMYRDENVYIKEYRCFDGEKLVIVREILNLKTRQVTKEKIADV